MITLKKTFVGNEETVNGVIPCYKYVGHCLPTDITKLPVGPGIYNGSEVTIMGNGTVFHYDAENAEWINFLGGDE